MDKVDAIINSKWLMDHTNNSILEDHALIIDGNIIKDVLHGDEAKRKYSTKNNTVLNNHIVIPGMLNSNYNSSVTMLGSENKIYEKGLESKTNELYTKFSTQISVINMIKKGVTTFFSSGIYSNSIIDEIIKTRIRSCIGLTIQNKSTVFADNEDEYLEKSLKILDYYKGNPDIRFFFNPISVNQVSTRMLKKISKIANELDISVRININTSNEEIKECIKNHGCRPLEYMVRLDMINNKFVALNTLLLNETDLGIIQDYMASIVINKSTLLLSKNIKIKDLIEKKINIILSTGVSPFTNSDMFEEMSVISLISNIKKNEVSTENIFRFATVNPALSLGLDDLVGILDKGYLADIVSISIKDIIQTNSVAFDGIENHLKSENIDNVWVSGKQLMKNSKILTIQENSVYDRYRKIKDKVNSDEY